MRLRALVDRRFEVLSTGALLAVVFLAVVWATMVVLKAANPVTFHFNLLMDILPWATPTAIIALLVGPLYWRVAGILRGREEWARSLAAHRYPLLVGSAFYLAAYTVVCWIVMVTLRAWLPVYFHYNFVVDWMPAILPPWLVWLVAGPIAYQVLGVVGADGPARRQRLTRRWGAGAFAVLGAALMSAGGLILNQGVYAGTQGNSALAGHAQVAFGTLLLTVGGACWTALLMTLGLGLRAEPSQSPRLTPVDRFRLARPRLLVVSFIWANILVAVIGLLMVALQYVDAQDFHWYFALDLWLLSGPILFGWMVWAALAMAIPSWLAARWPGRWGPGALVATGPTGAGAGGWGYRGEAAPAERESRAPTLPVSDATQRR